MKLEDYAVLGLVALALYKYGGEIDDKIKNWLKGEAADVASSVFSDPLDSAKSVINIIPDPTDIVPMPHELLPDDWLSQIINVITGGNEPEPYTPIYTEPGLSETLPSPIKAEPIITEPLPGLFTPAEPIETPWFEDNPDYNPWTPPDTSEPPSYIDLPPESVDDAYPDQWWKW